MIDWAGGAVHDFDVAFSTASITGLEAFDIIEADTTLTTVRQDFGFGVFIDGISFHGHSNIGWAGGENWWHYWLKDSGQASWTAPLFGVADRVLTDGDADGWVYGNAGEPVVPEPATMALMLTAAAAVLRRRKRAV